MIRSARIAVAALVLSTAGLLALDPAAASERAAAREAADTSSVGRSRDVRDVRAFGAYCDDVHDDRAAIQAALDSGGGAPIVVRIPSGVCRICSVGNGGSALTIKYDNVTLEGNGRTHTMLKYFASGCRDPSKNWDVYRGAVWRGHAIAVMGPNRRNVTIRNLRLHGQMPRDTSVFPLTMDPPFPASLASGDGWDLTNKGVYFEENRAHSGHRLEDLEIDGFKGEGVYYGGAGMDDLAIERVKIHDTNGDGISVSARVRIRNSEVYRTTQAVENSPFAHDNTIEGNYFHDNGKGTVFPANIAGNGAWGKTRISGNLFRANARGDVWVTGYVSNVDVVRNVFVDSSPYVETAAIRVLDQYGGTPTGILIEENEFQADTLSPWCAFYPSMTRTGRSGVVFSRNRITRTPRAERAGLSVQKSIRFDLGTTARLDVLDNDLGGAVFLPEARSRDVAMAPLYVGNKVEGLAAGTSLSFVEASSAVRYESPIVFLDSNTAGASTPVRALDTSNARDGAVVRFLANAAARPVHFESSGKGWALPARRTLDGRTYLDLRFDGVVTHAWHEVSYGVLPTAADQSPIPVARYELPLFFGGKPRGGALMWQVILPRVAFPASWTTSCSVHVSLPAKNATDLTMTVRRRGARVASARIHVGAGSDGSDASITWDGIHATTGFVAQQNDVMSISAPDPADERLGDVSLLLVGERY